MTPVGGVREVTTLFEEVGPLSGDVGCYHRGEEVDTLFHLQEITTLDHDWFGQAQQCHWGGSGRLPPAPLPAKNTILLSKYRLPPHEEWRLGRRGWGK
jgi:hypothetical protein